MNKKHHTPFSLSNPRTVFKRIRCDHNWKPMKVNEAVNARLSMLGEQAEQCTECGKHRFVGLVIKFDKPKPKELFRG